MVRTVLGWDSDLDLIVVRGGEGVQRQRTWLVLHVWPVRAMRQDLIDILVSLEVFHVRLKLVFQRIQSVDVLLQASLLEILERILFAEVMVRCIIPTHLFSIRQTNHPANIPPPGRE